MTPSLLQVEEQALQLSPTERAKLAELLWQSLDETTEEDVAQAWHDELGHRVEALNAGQCELIASDVVINRLRQQLTRG